MVNGQPPAVRGGSSRPEPKPDRPTPRVPGVHSRRVLHPDLRLDPTPNLDVVEPVAGCRQPPEYPGPRFGHLGVSDGPPSPIDIGAVCSGRNDQAHSNHHSQHQAQERPGDALEPSMSCLLCHAFPFLPLAFLDTRRITGREPALGGPREEGDDRDGDDVESMLDPRPPLPPASLAWASPANKASDLDRGAVNSPKGLSVEGPLVLVGSKGRILAKPPKGYAAPAISRSTEWTFRLPARMSPDR
jgi:hypothetical protein